MEDHPKQLSRTARPWHRAGWAVVVVLWALAAPGCVLLDKCTTCYGGPPAPGTACQVVTTWSNKVHYIPDPANGGVPAPGLAGRLYLFGPTVDFPMTGDGTAVVQLFDEGAATPGGQLLEQWEFNQEMLRRLLKKDTIGWGYTLVLPWGRYQPDLTRVRLTCCYTPAKGTPLFADPSSVTLDHGVPPPGTTVPGGATAQVQAQAPPVPVPAVPSALPMPRPAH
jgi:hypothetical protein